MKELIGFHLMSETADLIAQMVKMLQDNNAGMVNAGIGKYHIIVCTNEASEVIQEAYDRWATGEDEE